MFRCRSGSRQAVSKHSTGHWVRLGAAAVLLASVSQTTLYGTPVASADHCPDAEVVFARGTDEPKGMGRVGDAFADALRDQAVGMDIATYAVNYDAGKLQLHGGDGAKDAISHIKATAASCPNTKIVLGGYSQGASIVDIISGIPVAGITWGDPLPLGLADNVAAVATFGNVANRTGGTLPASTPLFAGKGIDMCNPSDPICHAGPGNAWSGHTQGYVPGYTTQAAAFAASKLLLTGTGQSVPGLTSPDSAMQMPQYATPPQGSDHMPPGYVPPAPGSSPSNPGYGQAPGYDSSVVTGLP
jgi:cutinase